MLAVLSVFFKPNTQPDITNYLRSYDTPTEYSEQVAQLSQRYRATLCAVEYFAKSLKITQGHSKWYLFSRSYPAAAAAPINIPLKLSLYVVAFPRYSALNNGMTLESGEGGRGSSWSLKMVSLDRSYTTYTIWSAVVCIV